MKAGTEIPEGSSVKKVRVFDRAGRWGLGEVCGCFETKPLCPNIKEEILKRVQDDNGIAYHAMF